MAEETGGSQVNICKHNHNAKTPDNGWIVCRSQKRPGRFYDFNTATGEAVWRDDNAKPHCSAIVDQKGIDCHEPTEPPVDAAPCNQDCSQNTSTARIYNKQIINDQFPTKTIISPFGNSPCTCIHSNVNNNSGLSAAPTIIYPWMVPPAPQVLIGPTVPNLNQLQTIFGGMQNMQIQNTSVPLSSRFQVLKQFKDDGPPDLLKARTGFNESYHIPSRNNWNFTKDPISKPIDLRNVIRARKRQDLQNDVVVDSPETNKDIPTSITDDDIDPDDFDEWLETHTHGDGKTLAVDMECIWEFADSKASRECWYIVPTTGVLLNNYRFLCSLVASDPRARVLAPTDALRVLRRATFSDSARVAERAKRAIILVRQMSKHADSLLEDTPNVKSGLELIDQNKHVIFLFDENDKHHQEIKKVMPKFTVNELKQYLTRYSEANTVSKIQNVKIIVPNNEVQIEPADTSSISSSQRIPSPDSVKTPKLTWNSLVINDMEIQTDPPTTPEKRTANASVQTDFDFSLSQKDKCKAMKISRAVDTAEISNDNMVTKAEPRKIRLKRQHQPANIINESKEKKTFKWRKKKDTGSTSNEKPPQVDGGHKSSSYGYSSLSTSTDDLNQQNDNAVDYGLSDVGVDAKIVDETSTSGVISNSVDSDSMFKISKEAILNVSKGRQKKEVAYEIASDFMEQHLRTRCDEWVSRFVQIMEEVLTQVLHMEPPFVDSTSPPPWTVWEATECIKRKFKTHGVIVDASDELSFFLLKISDDRGNINTDISPKDFMQMYSYGVNVINVLQMELKHEDLQIASSSLNQLLSDIREHNVDESNEFLETFPDDDPLDHSANVSETLTNLSNTDAVDNNTAPASIVSPQEKRIFCNDSPSKYSLRSSRLRRKQKEDESRTEVIRSEKSDVDYCLFSSLGLQKKNFIVDTSIVQTISNVHNVEPRLTPPTEQIQATALGVKLGEPKIIRNFSICPEIENKLKDSYGSTKEVDYGIAEEDETEDVYQAGEGNVAENTNFTEDKDSEHDSKEPTIKMIIRISTWRMHQCINNTRSFCEDTYNTLKCTDYWEPEYKMTMTVKVSLVSTSLKVVCDHLMCILQRDPSATKRQFRKLLNLFADQDFEIDDNDNWLDEYRATIETYLKHANLLLTFLTCLTAAIKKK